MSERTVLLGRTADGGRVYVNVRTTVRSGPHTMRDHSVSDEPLTRLSISGEYVERHSREADAAGQIVDTVRQIVEPEGALSLADIAEFADAWERWHLNDMHAECVHQDMSQVPADAVAYEWLRVHNTCPEGYRYGSAWLAERVPDAVLDRVNDILDRAPEAYRY